MQKCFGLNSWLNGGKYSIEHRGLISSPIPSGGSATSKNMLINFWIISHKHENATLKNTYFETTNCKEYQWGHGCNLREFSRSFIRSNATIQTLNDFQNLKIQEFGANVNMRYTSPPASLQSGPKKTVLNGVIYI